jgi:hypothetical protein
MSYAEEHVAMRKFIAALLLTGLVWPFGAVAQSPTAPLATFPNEQQAQQHCPADTVVWVNLPSAIYHFKGERWYGNTKSGAYVCQREADRAGDRATRNGQ